MSKVCSMRLWRVSQVVAGVIASLAVAAAPAHANDVPSSPTPAASCNALAEQAPASPMPQVKGSDTHATTADRIAATMAPGIGRPVTVQNSKQATKDMVFLDKVATSAKLDAAVAEVEVSEECSELGLVWDPSGAVGCSDSLGACFETGFVPCTDAPGIPDDTYCASWSCRWW
jgi:hypothetical protein